MHIPDGFLSGEICAAGYLVSGGTIAWALKSTAGTLSEKRVPLLGVTAAFIFAAQMINFPVAGGTSGHFLGAALAAILLGPFSAVLLMTIVLTVQCLGFADGGLAALGANIFNMGIVAGFGAFGVFRLLNRLCPKSYFLAVAAASWFSIVLAAVICALELALSGTSPLKLVLPAMVGIHALIGLGEAFITAAVVAIVAKFRPDLFSIPPPLVK